MEQSSRYTTYIVNYHGGIKGCQTNLPRVVPVGQLESVGLIRYGFRKIITGRADIMIASEMGGMSVLLSDEFKNSGLQVVGIMEKFTSHAFLHEQHKALAPKLSLTLKNMKAEGLFFEYAKSVRLPRYFNTE